MAASDSVLHRYWIKFETRDAGPKNLNHGVGVTAFSLSDALNLVEKHVWKGLPIPKPASIVEDIDVSKLDTAQVRPNMDEPAARGIWFPKGFSTSDERRST